VKAFLKKTGFPISVLFVSVLFCLAYSNHFHNPFQFDDEHTIVSNNYVRSIANIPLFFKDARTSSSLPANQTFRPGLTTLNAIDFWFGGKADPDPFYYHLSIFISFFFLGILLYFFFLRIFDNALSSEWNRYFALFATAFFCLHAANAETINYIIARSDSFSTLMVVAGMVLYIYGTYELIKWLALIPVCLGLLVKEPAVMFGPLLFFYLVFFTEELSLTGLLKKGNRKKLIRCIEAVFPALVLSGVYFVVSKRMTPPTLAESRGGDTLHYLLSQPFAIVHYINNFVLPFNLSADTDWEPVARIADDRVLTGSLVLSALLILAFYLSRHKVTRPISFGLLWFFIALIPSSSVFPLAEVLNDHRPFFPYIGLVMAGVWSFVLLIRTYANTISFVFFRYGIVICSILFLCLHAYGTHRRNTVWSSGESLWLDVTLKSPKNARGLMNYANTQMAKANYPLAEDYFQKALKLWPAYSYLYINMGVLKAATGNPQEAESNFRKALNLNPLNPECYGYYARWLKDQGRFTEAKECLQKGLSLSPEHIGNKRLLDEIRGFENATAVASDSAEARAASHPSPENYLNLSLIFYNQKNYIRCVAAAREAIKLKPDYAEAYNNICSAYVLIGNYDEAIKAGTKALSVKPGFDLAKNNLNDALTRKSKEDELLNPVRKKPTVENLINLSLFYYTNGRYQDCVDAAKAALKLNPRSDVACNNICSAYNMLGMWDQAIEAGEAGLSINPGSELLQNNLAVSRKNRYSGNKSSQ